MGGIYQLTFFLALALLAIVVAIFVFAVSLLGRAMQAAATSEREKLTERKESNVREMEAMQKDIEKAKETGRIPKGLIRKLKKLEKRDRNFEKELSKIRRAPELLTVRGGVVHPGIFLGIALVLTGVAWYLSGIEIPTAPVIMWGLGLAAIGYSIYRIYRSLKVVESVAITSEEAALKRTVEAFKIAQKELEEERRPELRLSLVDEKFPLRVRADSESSFRLRLNLTKGEFAEDVEIHVCLPPGFDFPNEQTYTLSSSHPYPNYIGMVWRKGRIIQLDYQRTITFKLPSTAGKYNIVFYKFCRGFVAEPVEREIIVE
jgi:hypothetical protein